MRRARSARTPNRVRRSIFAALHLRAASTSKLTRILALRTLGVVHRGFAMRTPRTTRSVVLLNRRGLQRPRCKHRRSSPGRRRSTSGGGCTTRRLYSYLPGSDTRSARIARTPWKLRASTLSTRVYPIAWTRSLRHGGRGRSNRHETLLLRGHGGEENQKTGALIVRSGSHDLDPPTWRAKDVVGNEHLWDCYRADPFTVRQGRGSHKEQSYRSARDGLLPRFGPHGCVKPYSCLIILFVFLASVLGALQYSGATHAEWAESLRV